MPKGKEDFTLVRDQITYLQKKNIEVDEHKKLLLCVVHNNIKTCYTY